MERVDWLIVGGGPAGQKAAVQAAKAGCSVMLVDAARKAGGACVRQGTIPSKTLRETALAFRNFKRRSGDVVALDVPADIELASLMLRKETVIEQHERYMTAQLERNQIRVLQGRARFVDNHTMVIEQLRGEERVVRADHIVLATGSQPRNPPDVPIDHEQCARQRFTAVTQLRARVPHRAWGGCYCV